MCGFIAQLVEHRTGIAEVSGSNPVEALVFSGFFFPIAYIGKLPAMITLPFQKPTPFLCGCNLDLRQVQPAHTAVSRKVVLKKPISERDNVESYYG